MLSAGLLGCLLVGTSGCEALQVGGDNRLGQLSVYMQQRYRRELHKDNFEINYSAHPPKKILISVRHRPSANRNLIGELVESAREIIRRKGYELYRLENIEVDVEMREL